MKKIIFLNILILLSMFCHMLRAADGPQNLAIRAGRIWTVKDGVIENGVIIIKNGKIRDVRKKQTVPKNIEVLDLSDKTVIPGLIDAHCHIGLSLDIFSEIDEPDIRAEIVVLLQLDQRARVVGGYGVGHSPGRDELAVGPFGSGRVVGPTGDLDVRVGGGDA